MNRTSWNDPEGIIRAHSILNQGCAEVPSNRRACSPSTTNNNNKKKCPAFLNLISASLHKSSAHSDSNWVNFGITCYSLLVARMIASLCLCV